MSTKELLRDYFRGRAAPASLKQSLDLFLDLVERVISGAARPRPH